MDRERKREERRNPWPRTADFSTTRTPLKLPQMPNTKSQMLNPKAFTLIELLVVIAVIDLQVAISITTLPVAILMPVLSRVLHLTLQEGYCVYVK